MWILMLSCYCANTGSTGGGIKMFRTLVLFRQAGRELMLLVHPQAVRPVKIAGQVVQNQIVFAVLAFVVLYFGTVVVLTFALLASGLDFISSFSAIIACINNAGPGLGVVRGLLEDGLHVHGDLVELLITFYLRHAQFIPQSLDFWDLGSGVLHFSHEFTNYFGVLFFFHQSFFLKNVFINSFKVGN